MSSYVKIRKVVVGNRIVYRIAEVVRNLGLYIISIAKIVFFNNNLTYNDLYGLIYYSPQFYNKILMKMQGEALAKIREKKVKKVGFIVYSSSIWQYDLLYRMLEQRDDFEPIIYIVGYGDEPDYLCKERYDNAKEYYIGKGYNTYGTYFDDEKKSDALCNHDLDYLFVAIPYYNIFPKTYCYYNLYPTKTLLCYSAYGVAINKISDRYFNLKIHNMAWRVYYETLIHKDMATQVAYNKGSNAIVSGYPKTDVFYEKDNEWSNHGWKYIDSDFTKVYKIIYAPHHVRKYGNFATFGVNYKFFLELAKKMPNTSWVFRPHPLLKQSSVECGIFDSIQEYDNYVSEWNKLSNAMVSLGGDYYDLFMTSDLLILDSESFLLEYQYTGKPLIFLQNNTQVFNEFGKQLMDVLYKVGGSEYKAIEEMVFRLKNGEDEKKNERQLFFGKYLDYRNINGTLASEFIVGDMLNANKA